MCLSILSLYVYACVCMHIHIKCVTQNPNYYNLQVTMFYV